MPFFFKFQLNKCFLAEGNICFVAETFKASEFYALTNVSCSVKLCRALLNNCQFNCNSTRVELLFIVLNPPETTTASFKQHSKHRANFTPFAATISLIELIFFVLKASSIISFGASKRNKKENPLSWAIY